MHAIAEINGVLSFIENRRIRPVTLKLARQLGRDSVADRNADNPFAYDEPREQEFAEAWDEARADRDVEMGEEYADYCDPSMRDLYE